MVLLCLCTHCNKNVATTGHRKQMFTDKFLSLRWMFVFFHHVPGCLYEYQTFFNVKLPVQPGSCKPSHIPLPGIQPVLHRPVC